MKILACGSRTWSNWIFIQRVLAEYPADSLLIHGAARGADQLSATAALNLGMRIQAFPADWSRGRSAGFVRNLQMLDEKPDVVLAFWDGSSAGTSHTIRNAQKRGLAVRIFLPTGEIDVESAPIRTSRS